MFKKSLLIALLIGTVVVGGFLVNKDDARASSTIIPDISEWQGKLTSHQVKKLKKQVAFIINRRQYGTYREDKFVDNNTKLYQKFGIPFGEYDFATFRNASEAKLEAKTFYHRSNKHAKFYVLDYEQSSGQRGNTDAMVKAWYQTMRKLTPKKLIFYSYQSFALKHASKARKNFDGQWIANYSKQPSIKTDLWQYTDKKHVPALKQSIDASKIMSLKKDISWWTGETID